MTDLQNDLLDEGDLQFSVESRILRELGERLVKQPEVAVLELIKNTYDADATSCDVDASSPDMLTVTDDGHGMTLTQFQQNWMRVGTSAKAARSESRNFKRAITGEKGIGRFAVRFLGERLRIISIAVDEDGEKTRLSVEFDWPKLDDFADLNRAKIPYQLSRAAPDESTGTRLEISDLKVDLQSVNWRQVKTGSIGVVTPLRALIDQVGAASQGTPEEKKDPGFVLSVQCDDVSEEETDLAGEILQSYVLRARVRMRGTKLAIQVFERSAKEPFIEMHDKIENELGDLDADIRFFPKRKGTFDAVPVDGRRAYSWVKSNSGVAVFDRGFRVLPYGLEEDDWLQLQADTARNRRDPRSSISEKHFAMQPHERADTKVNWMLRLPQSAQLIGIVQIKGRRSSEKGEKGLVAAADREGFVDNEAFQQLFQIIRGASEMIAVADRRIQQRLEEAARKATLKSTREQTAAAIAEIEASKDIPAPQKKRVVAMLAEGQQRLEQQEESSAKRQAQLEVMSLLGVIAGYMTHEFGMAVDVLNRSLSQLDVLAKQDDAFAQHAGDLRARIKRLKEFSTYSRAYVEGARQQEGSAFKVLPRVRQVIKLLGAYAEKRDIDIELLIDKDLYAPSVPVALYNGILQNLYTNSLKAVSSRRGGDDRKIAFRSWNDAKFHYLQVSDSGIGIPTALQDKIFDPLFSTTDMNTDPLGSGMGLGLSLIKRGVEAFRGRVSLTSPPPGFSTCVEVRFPLDEDSKP